nr:MAG TPA: hypothetical protein [Caudoviricetes sp.]
MARAIKTVRVVVRRTRRPPHRSGATNRNRNRRRRRR